MPSLGCVGRSLKKIRTALLYDTKPNPGLAALLPPPAGSGFRKVTGYKPLFTEGFWWFYEKLHRKQISYISAEDVSESDSRL